MLSKRNFIIGVLLVVLLAAPVAQSGGAGWRLLEERLGLVEQQAAETEAANAELANRVAALEWKVLRLQSRVGCLEKHVLGRSKARCPVVLP